MGNDIADINNDGFTGYHCARYAARRQFSQENDVEPE
jgi:hypothetical protein